MFLVWVAAVCRAFKHTIATLGCIMKPLLHASFGAEYPTGEFRVRMCSRCLIFAFVQPRSQQQYSVPRECRRRLERIKANGKSTSMQNTNCETIPATTRRMDHDDVQVKTSVIRSSSGVSTIYQILGWSSGMLPVLAIPPRCSCNLSLRPYLRVLSTVMTS